VNRIFKNISKLRSNPLVYGSIVNFSIKSISFLINYLIMFIIIYIFGTSYFGVYNLYLSLISVFSVFMLFGTDILFLKEASANFKSKSNRKLLKKIVLIILTLFILLIIFSFISTHISFFNNYYMKNEINIYFIIIIGLITAINLLLLSGLRAANKILLFSLGEKFFQRFIVLLLSIIILISNINMTPITLISVSVLFNLLFLLLFFNNTVFREMQVMDYTKTYSYPELFGNLKFIFTSTFILIILGQLDTLVISIFYEPSYIGNYNIVLQISILINFTMGSINSILSPIISKEFKGKNFSSLEKNLKVANNMIFYSSLVIATIILIFSNKILLFIGGNTQLVVPLTILIVGQVLSASMGSIVNILNMTGNYKVVSKSMFIALIVNVVLNFTLTPTFGLAGAALSTSISYIIKDVYCTLYAVKYLEFKVSIISSVINKLKIGG
jgi:O-antigen/teichoic acid export membrane protein